MSIKPFTLLQVSDCHLTDDPNGLYRDQSPDACLQKLLPALKATRPDGLILSGDVAEEGGRDAYERAAAYLDGLAPMQTWIPGNHDDRDIMEEVFMAHGYSKGPVLEWGEWRVILLDSVLDQEPSGWLGDQSIELLTKESQSNQPTFVFVHHQPLLVGSHWIDRYPLKNGEALMAAIDSSWVKAVAFGHVHQVFSEVRDGIQYLSAPATSVNSQSGFDSFTTDPTGPKARWFKWWPDGRWATGVISAG